MSIFDPQDLYYQRKKYSYKGQIKQKKAVSIPYAVSPRDAPRSISVLRNLGYTVLPPGEPYQAAFSLLRANSLSYSDAGTLSPDESFIIKFKDFMYPLLNRPDYAEIRPFDVIQCNIELITTQITNYSNATTGSTILNVKFPNNNNLVITKGSGILRNLIFADNQENKVNVYSYVGNSSTISWPNTNTYPGILSWKYIEGDSNIYTQILNNNFTDQRFEETIVEFNLGGTNDYPLTEVAINFSIGIFITYKSSI